MRRFFAALLLSLLAFSGLAATDSLAASNRAAIDSGFREFLEKSVWPAARAKGVPRGVFEAAFSGVKPNLDLPDLALPGEAAPVPETNFQAEFQSPAAYFAESKLAPVVTRGRQMMAQYSGVLDRIERETGVPGAIIVAIWGRESGFGAAKIPYNAFEVLGTKAYLSRRKDFFFDELVAALQIVADGHLKVGEMRSSWAGALGQPQFMPTKFLKYATDFDGDGRRDIWSSAPDTLASIGRYLADAGWERGRDWGFEANVPSRISCAEEGPDRRREISRFVAQGVTRVSGRDFPPNELSKPGNILMPAGRYGPAFIATPNFYVIKAYNNSDLYALFVGHAADRMRGGRAFEGGWVANKGLTRGDVARLQTALQKQGYDVGGADGLAGFKTRRSIGAWQEKNGRAATCWPSADLKNLMR
ncbi:lytic murein transglycosylase [Consotaella salsifontis]|uniref:Lytic murein transglycosylase n=1 Tax=Consotaella salsifontis TaxID=1365950 RepID=A0A1T4T8Z1_9HYPH|nr:lytic murein transglycosylase [Consotaella salsifontis]SKA36896.1 lytic murein transglycosylase [Consotaella salsifontis]